MIHSTVSESLQPQPTLFISHDARRHGAQLFLLNFLRWVHNHAALPFEVCCRGDGDLAEEFQALAPTLVCERQPDQVPTLQARIARGDFGLVYVNTMANGDLLAQFQPACPVVTHLHELECMIRYHVGSHSLELTRMQTDRFIACSRAVRDNLIERHGIPEADIDLVHEFIPIDPVAIQRARAEAAGLRASLGIPPEALIVGASGTTDWRKGPDLFVQLARLLQGRPMPRPVYFLWVGGDRCGREYGQLCYDVAQAGLGDRVRFMGERTNPLAYFALFDVFTLVSREDPYPLVVLEAASLGLPILGFQGSGGVNEFVETDCGYCVPYLALNEMADRLTDLLAREELRYQLGQQAARKVRERHCIDSVAPRLVDLIRSQHVLKNVEEMNRFEPASA